MFWQNKTKEFIKIYSKFDTSGRYSTRDADVINADWQDLIEHEKKVNLFEVKTYLRKLDNDDFLKTIYWQVVRNKKMLIDGFCCQFNVLHDNKYLNVHHKEYQYKGNDSTHLDTLITLCKSCHNNMHDIDKKNGVNIFKRLDILESLNDEINNNELIVDTFDTDVQTSTNNIDIINTTIADTLTIPDTNITDVQTSTKTPVEISMDNLKIAYEIKSKTEFILNMVSR